MRTFRQFIKESIIDIPRKNYSRTIFTNPNTKNPVLKSSVKKFIETGMSVFEKIAPIKKHLLIGSILTKQYRKDADLDINLFFDLPPGKRESAIIELRRMVSKANGKPIPGTKHPVNYYVIGDKATYDRANEMADNVYDIANSSFIKRSPEQEFSVKDYMKDFTKKVEKIDILKGELDRDIVDYEELKELDKDDIDNLSGQVKKKIGEIEKDMKVLISMGHGIWKERQGEFKKDMSPKEIQKYGTHNRLPKNVVYKMLEKYYYIKLMHDLEDILGDDDKLSDTEADKLVKNIPDISEEKTKSYFEVGHPRMKHIKGNWTHPHIELFTKAHGGSMHKTALSNKIDAHDMWDKSNEHIENERVHANGRIDHKNKQYSVVVHVSASKREPHPKAIRKAYDGVHKHMEEHHPEYTSHEQGHQFY